MKLFAGLWLFVVFAAAFTFIGWDAHRHYTVDQVGFFKDLKEFSIGLGIMTAIVSSVVSGIYLIVSYVTGDD